MATVAWCERRASTPSSASFPVEALTARSVRRTIAFVGRASERAILRYRA